MREDELLDGERWQMTCEIGDANPIALATVPLTELWSDLSGMAHDDSESVAPSRLCIVNGYTNRTEFAQGLRDNALPEDGIATALHDWDSMKHPMAVIHKAIVRKPRLN